MTRGPVVTVAVLAAFGWAQTQPVMAANTFTPIGVHSMLQLNAPASFMQAMFAEAAGMHASAIRLDVAPEMVFSGPSSPPDFSGLNEVMALAQQYHLRVVADLFTIPSWIAACQTPTAVSQMDRCGTDDLVEYGTMVSEIVAHADPVIRDWEIWNEPDTGWFFTGTAQQYAEMLRTAHDAVKAVDPQANVLLGGISSTAGMIWLAQVFAVPGANAAGAFDVANIHERAWLDSLDGDVVGWKRFLAAYGFNGPLWVTEHGYPSDPAFQYDPAYTGGVGSQAGYLAASIPTLIDAGAAEVFVTERDNLGGQFASEGLLGGTVSDPPVANPIVVEKPAYAEVAAIAQCYLDLGRDCPGPAPAASPASLSIPPARLGSSTIASVSVSDPGPAPLQLGAAAITGADPGSIALQRDSCSGQILEPGQTCPITLRFTPVADGVVTASLALPSDDGVLAVAVSAVAPSVSSLISAQPFASTFSPTHAADGVGHTQRRALVLINPLSTPIHIGRSTVTGPDARRFLIQSDACVPADLSPAARCHITVLFTPARPGTASAVLALSGDGTPLGIPLRATAFALPAVTRLEATGRTPCFALGSGNRVRVATDQPSVVSWRLTRQPRALSRCARRGLGSMTPGAAGRSSAAGHARTRRRRLRPRGTPGYVTQLALPAAGGPRGLKPGAYRLTVLAADAHGTGRPRTMWLAVLG